jgi:hypothetical protein
MGDRNDDEIGGGARGAVLTGGGDTMEGASGRNDSDGACEEEADCTLG